MCYMISKCCAHSKILEHPMQRVSVAWIFITTCVVISKSNMCCVWKMVNKFRTSEYSHLEHTTLVPRIIKVTGVVEVSTRWVIWVPWVISPRNTVSLNTSLCREMYVVSIFKNIHMMCVNNNYASGLNTYMI